MAFPTDWGRRCALVIQSGQVTDNEVNFPLLVTEDTLPSEIFDADGSYPALNGGGDIRFSSDEEGNTQLACEIESFITDNDPANGKAAIWVKVPSLSSSSNTTIYIWYNKAGESQPAEDNAYGKENVWDSGFVMVQHMNQTPDGTADEIVDSTANDNDGTTSGMDSADQVAGQIDGSLDFDWVDNYVDIFDSETVSTKLQSIGDNNNYTLVAWIKTDAAAGTNEGYWRSEQTIIDLVTQLGAGANRAPFSFGIEDTFICLGRTHYHTTSDERKLGSIAVNDGNWHSLVASIQDDVVDFYVDGVLDVQKTFTVATGDCSVGSTASNMQIGVAARTDGTKDKSFFDGSIDEVRISNVARSAGWIATEYNNQYSPSTFLIEGTPETPGAYSEQFKDLLSEISAETTAQFLDLYTEIGTKSQIFKDLLSEIIVNGEQVYDFSCNIDTKAQSIFDLLSEISAEKLQLLDLPTGIETKAQQLYDLLSAISVKSADQLQDLFTEIRAAKQSHKDLLSEIIAGSEKYYDLISDIKTKKQRLKDLITEISATAETEVLKDLLSEIVAGKVQHSDLNTEIETGAQEIKNLLSEISASREQMVDLVSDISIGIEHFFDLSTEVGIKAQSFKDLLSDISVGAEVEVFSDLLSEISVGVELIDYLKTPIQAAREELLDLSVEIIAKGQIFYELSSEIAATYSSFPRYIDLLTQIAAGVISFAQVRREFTVRKRTIDFTIVPRTTDFTIVK